MPATNLQNVSAVYVDLDDVLADFYKGWLLLQPDYELIDKKRHQHLGEWDLQTILELSDRQMWDAVRFQGADFWRDLPEKYYATSLLHMVQEFCEKHNATWYVLTGPQPNPDSLVGKQRWLNNFMASHFPEECHTDYQQSLYFDRMIPTLHKHLLAKPGTLLIDDADHNVNAFRQAEGDAILYPVAGNTLHKLRSDSHAYDYVVRELAKRFPIN